MFETEYALEEFVWPGLQLAIEADESRVPIARHFERDRWLVQQHGQAASERLNEDAVIGQTRDDPSGEIPLSAVGLDLPQFQFMPSRI
jgi:hypothetical protein